MDLSAYNLIRILEPNPFTALSVFIMITHLGMGLLQRESLNEATWVMKFYLIDANHIQSQKGQYYSGHFGDCSGVSFILQWSRNAMLFRDSYQNRDRLGSLHTKSATVCITLIRHISKHFTRWVPPWIGSDQRNLKQNWFLWGGSHVMQASWSGWQCIGLGQVHLCAM